MFRGRRSVLTPGLMALAGCGTASTDPGAGSSDPSPLVLHGDVVAELDTPAYAVAYDPSGDAVWFAEVGRGGPDRLWQAKESTGELTSFPLPAVEYNGFTTHLHVSDDGAVWVSLPYVLVRLDPATGSSKSLTFPKEAEEDALPAASDPGAPLPGTWISELAVVGSSVMVARMNMPYLSVVDATLTESRGPSLPDGYAGARSMARGPDGWLYLLPALDKDGPVLGLRGDRTQPMAQIYPQRLVEDPDGVIALGVGHSVGTLAGADQDQLATLTAPQISPWSRSNRGGTTATYDPAAGRVARQVPGQSTEVLALEPIAGVAAGGPPDQEHITRPETLTDFLVSEDGSVWLLRDGGAVVERWRPASHPEKRGRAGGEPSGIRHGRVPPADG